MIKRPQQQRSQETVEAILVATILLLEKDGLQRLSVDKIAKKAGVAVGSIYQFFANKDAILGALIDRYAEAVTDAMAQVTERHEKKTIELGVTEIIDSVISVYDQAPETIRILRHIAPQLNKSAVIEKHQKLAEKLIDAYLKALFPDRTSDETQMASFLLVNAFDAVITKSLSRECAWDSKALRQEMTHLAMAYLTRLPSRPLQN